MRKPMFRIGENKGTDQLCSYCEADQSLCVCYTDSTIPVLSKSKIYCVLPFSWLMSILFRNHIVGMFMAELKSLKTKKRKKKKKKKKKKKIPPPPTKKKQQKNNNNKKKQTLTMTIEKQTLTFKIELKRYSEIID